MIYSEKLKDPRWQRKRLEILQRDDFSCMKCWSIENTLHVHHKYYEKGLEPWEYENSILITLCEHCHKDETMAIKGVNNCIEHLYLTGVLPSELLTLIEAIKCIDIPLGRNREVLFNKMADFISDYKED